MDFEPTSHQKNLFTELQEAWAGLHERVLQLDNNGLRKKLLFYADECLGWNQLRHLPLMKHTLLSIHQVSYYQQADEKVHSAIEHVRVLMNELFTSMNLDWRV